MKSSSFTLIVSFVCLSLIGLVLLPLLPVKLSPSQNMPGMSVYFSMPGSSSRTIESEVTSKLESMFSRIKGVQSISSTSDNNGGSISLGLDKHADIEVIRFEVSTIIRQVWPQLPEGVSYPSVSAHRAESEADRPFLTYTINAPANPIDIYKYADERIKPALATLKGVYKVDLSGATPMEWQLEYDSDQLKLLGISIDDVQRAISLNYEKEFLGIGLMEQSNGGREWIRLTLKPDERGERFEPSSIFVRGAAGEMIALDKLVKVRHVEAAPQSYFRINGLNSIYLSVTADEGANQLKLAKAVKQCIAQLAADMPSGYELHASYDATEHIERELNKIYFRTGLTILILLLFVLLITRSLRYLLLIVLSLSMNLAVAFIFYYLFGIEIQLYSLAGITISLNLIIDNTIVMADHLRRQRDLRVFTSLLAATLTTIGALSVVYFLDERLRLSLQDFATVVIINLSVSLAVALFLVPALMQRIGLYRSMAKRRKARRFQVRLSHAYEWLIGVLVRFRVAWLVVLVLAFGLPVFMLPDSVEGDGFWSNLYNRTLGSRVYREDVKPIVDKALGGTLRLFAEKVYEGSYWGNEESEPVLSISATLPNGSTVEQMNALVQRMESYLSEFTEIRQFQTNVHSAYRASIQVYFRAEHQHSGFPYMLKANIISKSLTLGGGSWSVYGLQDQGFSNDIRQSAGSSRVKLYGYNYDELYLWAERLKAELLTQRRINEVTISSDFSHFKDDYTEFFLELDNAKMMQAGISPLQLYRVLRPVFGHDIHAATLPVDDGTEQIKLHSRQGREWDVWSLTNVPFHIGGKSYKLSDFATVQKSQAPQSVAKENQQYRLCLQYEYIGSAEQGRKRLEQTLEEFNKQLPMGYTARSESSYYSWGSDDYSQYALLLVIIAIIFVLSSVLFNSLAQPLAIIFVIPISYIGVFLTFYLFGLNFDQGGFASFVLLCGITVNASIYILSEFNDIRRRRPLLSSRRAYVRAWNVKMIPIFLTISSTLLGFIPFMVGEGKEAFWFPLAAGTMGGLIMSFVGIFFYLPMFVLKKK